MFLGSKKTAWEKEWDALLKKETNYGQKKEKKKDSKLNSLLADKVPDKLQQTLDTAFEKAFGFVFEKGNGVIEKTYKKESVSRQHEVDQFAVNLKQDRKSLQTFKKRAGKDGTKNILLSGVEGIGLGVLGIGLPDIPLFAGMVLKSLNETALRYGFEYESEEERYFQLKLMEAALSTGEEFAACNREIYRFSVSLTLPEDYDRKGQIKNTAAAFSKELLYMKFLQGIPLVGVAGGVYDAVYLGRIQEYAGLKYQKRFLLKQKHDIKEN